MTSARVARVGFFVLLVTLSDVLPAFAQASLSLAEAIRRARTHNPDVGSAAAVEREAGERVTQARGGYLPKVEVSESWQRGNHPVFVFSSLLAQRQFTAADFALDSRHRNLDGDRCGASGYTISPRATGLLLRQNDPRSAVRKESSPLLWRAPCLRLRAKQPRKVESERSATLARIRARSARPGGPCAAA